MTRGLSEDLIQLFDASVDAMFISDADGRIRRTNKAMQRLFGFPDDAVLHVEDFIPVQYRDAHARHIRHYHASPQARPMGEGRALLAQRHDGSVFPTEISLSPLSGERVLATVRDISAQVRAESQMLRWTARYTSLLTAIPDIVLELDAEHVIVWGNDAALCFFGQDAVGQTVLRYHAESTPLDLTECDSLKAWFTRADGASRLLSWRCREVPATDDAPARKLCSARDMTDGHDSEETLRVLRGQLQQIHGLQIAGQTVRKIAHDLNQPLNSVATYATTATHLLDMALQHPDLLREALKGCATEADRAGRVVHRLMDFLDRDSLQLVPINLREAVRNAIDLCQADGCSDTRFDIEIADDLWTTMGQPRQLESVLVNLITNSVEALRLEGVQAPRIRIEAVNDAENQAVLVRLHDNGPGLQPQIAQHAFAPFFTTKQKTIGLGLTISRALVEATGGELWFESEASPGATFCFTIPIQT